MGVPIGVLVYMFACTTVVGVLVGIVQKKRDWNWIPYFMGIVVMVVLVYPIRWVTGVVEYDFSLIHIGGMGINYLLMNYMGKAIFKAHFN